MPLRYPLWITAACLLSSAVMAQVVPDGSTSTVVTLTADGSVTVGIAPTVSDGISVNRYDDFNVRAPGVDLDNRAVAARTIVNEVTSTRSTDIEGSLSVLGQRAHVIVANPNGIRIDGGHFVNTGRVALTTGTIGSASRQIAPGVFQSNVTSTVNSGAIRVEGAGLSGQMDTLDLIANEIQINGDIDLGTDEPLRRLSFFAGGGVAEFDSSIIPGNLSSNWHSFTPSGTTDRSLLVDISSDMLSAGSIVIAVNNSGAGVRIADANLATSRSFSISSTGEVEIKRSKIDAGDTLAFQAASLDVLSSDIAVPNGNLIAEVSGDLSVTDSSVTAGGNVAANADTINLTSTGTDQAEIVAQNGSLVLSARQITNTGGLLQGAIDPTIGVTAPDGINAEGAVTLVTSDTFTNSATDDLQGLVFGVVGDTIIRSGDNIDNLRGRILSNKDIVLVANGAIRNQFSASPKDPVVEEFTTNGSRVWWTLFLKRKRTTSISYDYGLPLRTDQVPIITATGDARLTADAFSNVGGQVNANTGDLEITALKVETIGLGSGKLRVDRVCVLACSYTTTGEFAWLPAQLNAARDIEITGNSSILLDGGTTFATRNVTLNSPDIELRAVQTPLLVQRPRGLYNFWAAKGAWITLRSQFGTILAETGDLTVNSAAPIRINGGLLTAGGTIKIANGQNAVQTPDPSQLLEARDIGLLRNAPLVH